MNVKPIRCKAQPLAWADFLNFYGIKFRRLMKPPNSRFEVLKNYTVVDGTFTPVRIGTCFSEGCIWMFVPDKYPSNPGKWYFGQTRLDAVAGYFEHEEKQA